MTRLGVAVPALALIGLIGCVRFPQRLLYRVEFLPSVNLLEHASYYQDGADSSVVFSVDGARVKIRFLSDSDLNEEFAMATDRETNLNPFTYGKDRDLDLGYVPPRFTVMELTVVNQGLPRVTVDPARIRLVTDEGSVLPSWHLLRRDGVPSLEQYYMERRGTGGNEEYYYRERMGVAQRSLFRRAVWVWQGERYSGKVVFSPLRPSVRGVRLEIDEVVLRVDAYERPVETVDVGFSMVVKQGSVPQSMSILEGSAAAMGIKR